MKRQEKKYIYMKRFILTSISFAFAGPIILKSKKWRMDDCVYLLKDPNILFYVGYITWVIWRFNEYPYFGNRIEEQAIYTSTEKPKKQIKKGFQWNEIFYQYKMNNNKS